MSPATYQRDGEIEAFVVDRYLESLLARRPATSDGVPPELELTARRLASALPRYHPSFRFEEALAAQLAAVAGRIEAGELVHLPVGPVGPSGPVVRLPVGPHSVVPRPVVLGGVLTSAALSLAGAAFVAWRRTHPMDPMSRAVRAVARARIV